MMKLTIRIAAVLLLVLVFPAVGAQIVSGDENVVVYTNADVEKLEPLPTGRTLVDTSFDTQAWEFVAAFLARERAKITADRDHDLERDRVEIEAERPVVYAERYYPLRVGYAVLPRVREDARPVENAMPATQVPHPIFRARPPVREFTPGLGDSYRGEGTE